MVVVKLPCRPWLQKLPRRFIKKNLEYNLANAHKVKLTSSCYLLENSFFYLINLFCHVMMMKTKNKPLF